MSATHSAAAWKSRRTGAGAVSRVVFAPRQRRRGLAWMNLKENLVLNGLATEREIMQLNVHHRFLSGFTHPFSQDVTDSVYRQRIHGDWPTPEHYAMELLLRVRLLIAIDELRDFERMTQREPRVDLDGWDGDAGHRARRGAHRTPLDARAPALRPRPRARGQPAGLRRVRRAARRQHADDATGDT